MEFEYDPANSKINVEEHGINFGHAKLQWLDEKRIVVPARSITEPRAAIIAQHAGTLWIAIYTMRGDSIRLISVRRSRNEEREGYNNR